MRWLVLLLGWQMAWGAQAADEEYARAWQLAGQGKQEEATGLLRGRIERDRAQPRDYFLLSRIYAEHFRYEEGLKYFRGMASRMPGRAAAHYGLAIMLMSGRRTSEHLAEATQCVRLDPSLLGCYEAALNALARGAEQWKRIPRLGDFLPEDPGRAEWQYALSRHEANWGNQAAAVAAGEQAVWLARERGDAELLARCEVALAQALMVGAAPRVEESVGHRRAACEAALKSEHPDLPFEICPHLNRVDLGGGGEQGAAVMRELLERARAVANPRSEMTTLLALGGQAGVRGDLEAEAEYYTKGAALALSLRIPHWVSVSSRQLGETRMKQGEYELAVEAFQQGVAFPGVRDDPESVAHVLAKQTVAYQESGRTLEAIRTAEEAVQLFRQAGANLQAGAELSDVGMAYLTLGDIPTAIRYFRESLESGRRYQNAGEVVRNSMLLADAHLRAGRPAEAKRNVAAAMAALPDAREEKFEARARALLGEAESRMGEMAAASAEFEKALALVRRLKGAWLEADILARKGRHLLRAGDLRGAESAFEECLAIAGRASMAWQEQEAQAGLAEVARRRNQPEQVLERLRRAVDALESLRAEAPGPELRTGLLRRNWQMYEDLIETLNGRHGRAPAAGYDREALSYAERGRARVLLDLLAESRAGLKAGLNRAQAARQRALERRVSAALVKVREEGGAGARAELARAEREMSEWSTELRVSNPRYHALRYPEPLDAEGIRKLAERARVTIVEYALGKRRSRVWVANAGGIHSAGLPGQAVIEAQVWKMREALARHPAGAEAESYRRPAAELYRMLIGPVEGRLGRGARLVIVPDGILHYLPFETLLRADGRFLVEEAVLSYAPSASVYAQLERSEAGKGKRDLLAVGNPDFGFRRGERDVVREVYRGAGFSLRPLPGTEREVRALAALFTDGGPKLLLGAAASEEGLKGEHLAEYRRLHLATHALIDERAPMRSGIALSAGKAGKEDGMLLMNEIMGMTLEAEVVTLSACETGLGTLVRGEGMVGFTQAFLYAGAKRLVVSLWAVNDQAVPELMQEFYREMKEGSGVAEALRAAKLKMLRSGVAAYRHPHFWGAFVGVGRR